MFRDYKIGKILLSILILCIGISFAWVCVRAASTPLSTIGWQQVNETGFGDLQDISTLDVFEGQLYAGTWAMTGSTAEIWRTSDGKTWEKFSPPLITGTQVIFDAQVFSDSLYIGSDNIMRTNGTSWEQVASAGFGDNYNLGINSLVVFSNTLIVATSNITSGVEIWGSPTGDSGNWEQLNMDGFGLGITGQDSTMDTYDGFLNFGMAINGVATLLRTDDLITWTPVFSDGLGNPNNTNVSAMAELNGDFYIGLRNVTDGGEVWRTSNGVDFEPVLTGGKGNVDNKRPYGLIVYHNNLYLMFSNLVTGANVWRTSNGTDWEQVAFDGWGDPTNIFADYFDKGAVIYSDSLFVGTMTNIGSGEIWQLVFSPDSVAITGPTTGELETGYVFTGTVSPITATIPITYVWEATDYAPFTVTSGITSTIIYNWAIPGQKVISLTASNAAGTVSTIFNVMIGGQNMIYLPLVLRNYSTPASMVFVPPGDFQMGCDPNHNDGFECSGWQLPLHTISLDAYWIDMYEVTNFHYAECVAAGSCAAPATNSSFTRSSYYDNPIYANYPVIYINWSQAADYCAWAGKRLPTEAEWEKAARGPSPRAYPWGDLSPNCTYANYNNCVGDTTEVGSYALGASPYGAMDMSGNVWEWVNDWFQGNYYSISPINNPPGPESGTNKVIRGGSWSNYYAGDDKIQTNVRSYSAPAIHWSDVGFRCATNP